MSFHRTKKLLLPLAFMVCGVSVAAAQSAAPAAPPAPKPAATPAPAATPTLDGTPAPVKPAAKKKPADAPPADDAAGDDAAPADDAAPPPPAGGFGGGKGGGRRGGGAPAASGDAIPNNKVAYDFSLITPDGKNFPLSEYKGKALMFVNLGSKSSYAEQLPALMKLQDDYKAKGLQIIGIPNDEFGNAEPGTIAEVAKTYADLKVNFPVVEKTAFTGTEVLPLFTYLTKDKTVTGNGVIHWNYTKYITDKKGKVLVRLEPDVKPDSLEMRATLDEVLAGTYKPKKAGGGGPGGGGPGGGGMGMGGDGGDGN